MNKEIYQRARKLISNGWCRGSFAKTKTNKIANWRDPNATKFCLLGACFKAGSTTNDRLEAMHGLKPFTNGDPARFNDSKRNKRDILRVLDRAIKASDESGTANQ